MSQQQNHGYGSAENDAISLTAIFQRLVRHFRLILFVTFIVTAASVMWAATRTPIYQAKATLLLESDGESGGILSELASITSDPAAESEIALIQSRSLAVVTAARSSSFKTQATLFVETEADFDPVRSVANDSNDSSEGALSNMDSMGLSTVVEAYSLRPYVGIIGRFTGRQHGASRLRARMSPLVGAENDRRNVSDLDVYFPDEQTVLVTPHSRFVFAPSISADKDGVLEFAFTPGTPLKAFGHRIELAPTGDFVKERYRIRSRDEENAILALMGNTSVAEVGRNTDIISVAISDSCPYRAAETANALAKNYIRRSILIKRQKASRTLGFIKGQLTLQLAELESAERQVADLQSKNPQTISLSDSANAIIQQVASLELQRTQLQLAPDCIDSSPRALRKLRLSSARSFGKRDAQSFDAWLHPRASEPGGGVTATRSLRCFRLQATFTN